MQISTKAPKIIAYIGKKCVLLRSSEVWIKLDEVESATERKRNSMCESLQPFCHPLQECRVISYQVICAVLTALDGNNTFLRDWHELCPLLPTQDTLLTSVLLFLPMLTQQYSFFFEFLLYQFFHLCSWDLCCSSSSRWKLPLHLFEWGKCPWKAKLLTQKWSVHLKRKYIYFHYNVGFATHL